MNLKQILLLTLCVSLFNCETETVDTPEEKEETDNTLIKQIVYDMGTADEYTEVFSYTDGNKLTSIEAIDDYENVYTYEGDLLVKEESYYDGELWAYVTLEYNSEGLLFQYIEYWEEVTGFSERAYKKVFTYNDNNTIRMDVYLGNHDTQTDLNYTEIISFNGKNISKSVDVDGSTEYLYSYDDKNGMFKNIHAIEILNLLSENEFGPYMLGNTNNLTSDKEVYNGSSSIQSTDDRIEYTYNENDYPITGLGTRFNDGIEDEDSKYTMNFYYE